MYCELDNCPKTTVNAKNCLKIILRFYVNLA